VLSNRLQKAITDTSLTGQNMTTTNNVGELVIDVHVLSYSLSLGTTLPQVNTRRLQVSCRLLLCFVFCSRICPLIRNSMRKETTRQAHSRQAFFSVRASFLCISLLILLIPAHSVGNSESRTAVGIAPQFVCVCTGPYVSRFQTPKHVCK
jgi:hypothetical protein